VNSLEIKIWASLDLGPLAVSVLQLHKTVKTGGEVLWHRGIVSACGVVGRGIESRQGIGW
jgi:hypothetical protein